MSPNGWPQTVRQGWSSWPTVAMAKIATWISVSRVLGTDDARGGRYPLPRPPRLPYSHTQLSFGPFCLTFAFTSFGCHGSAIQRDHGRCGREAGCVMSALNSGSSAWRSPAKEEGEREREREVRWGEVRRLEQTKDRRGEQLLMALTVGLHRCRPHRCRPAWRRWRWPTSWRRRSTRSPRGASLERGGPAGCAAGVFAPRGL